MNTEAVLLALAITAVLCAAGLLVVLMWPTGKRKDVARPTVPASRWPRVE